jgi:hypothetical protein
MLGINVNLYKALAWVTSQFSRPLNNWWLNRKHRAGTLDSFDSLLVSEIRKTSLLPNIRDDAINALLGLIQGNLSYATDTKLFNDFL